MIETLRQQHRDLVRLIGELAAVTSTARPQITALASLRLKLGRASQDRSSHLHYVIYPTVERYLPQYTKAIAQLKQQEVLARSASTKHVGKWTLAAIEQDWSGYCLASKGIRSGMLDRIDLERRVLNPMLETLQAPESRRMEF
ncbi:hypothetical protein [Sphingomonas nostoxanthinifaciens]|uniref:hypothetical protein n=1 Tax=Sphingomonas nostoxanthinifaciens TaxID=2872652 RepID=UPI001CC21964|nr:hypothetical protein [Sphingomonas nostoxanthinifaciens]UAK25616.1 hypothetical protein K8P63_05560 [Sphingomonas nostoxanthinifaciens]